MDEEHSVGYAKRILSALKLTLESMTWPGCAIFFVMLIGGMTRIIRAKALQYMATVGMVISAVGNRQYSDRLYVIFVFYMAPLLLWLLRENRMEWSAKLYVGMGILFSFTFVSGSNMNVDAISTGMVISTIGCFQVIEALTDGDEIIIKKGYTCICLGMIGVCLAQRIF